MSTRAHTQARPVPFAKRALAWSAHLFTLTGVLWASLATIALYEGHIRQMWMWLGIALLVDAVDGSFARAVRVTEYAPGFDGATLDNIVDYLTWTFIPALFMVFYLPFGSRGLGIAAALIVCLSSMFCYCNVSLKTPDHYFMGFPAAWNVVAAIMWIFQTGALFNFIATVILAILTVAPIAFVHPFRVGRLRVLNIVAALVWVAATAMLVAYAPLRPFILTGIWWVAGIWILVVSAVRSIQGIPQEFRDAE